MSFLKINEDIKMKLQKICQKHGLLSEADTAVEMAKWTTNEGEKKERPYLRCRLCKREKDIKWSKLHKSEKIEYSKKWKKENKEHYNEWVKQDRLKNPEKYRKWAKISRERAGKMRSLKESLSLRNISLDEYNKMFEEQKGLCAICNLPESRRSRKGDSICRLTIDHCHASEKVRGLLCHDCNTGLGKFKDNQDLLLNALAYLERSMNM